MCMGMGMHPYVVVLNPCFFVISHVIDDDSLTRDYVAESACSPRKKILR